MLEIHEKTDISGYEKDLIGIDSDRIHIVESFNGKLKNGYGIYSVNEDNVTVYDYQSDELSVTDDIIISYFMSNCKKCKEL